MKIFPFVSIEINTNTHKRFTSISHTFFSKRERERGKTPTCSLSSFFYVCTCYTRNA